MGLIKSFAAFLISFVLIRIGLSVEVRLSINGLSVSERPFLDHLQQWPPHLSWTLESDSSNPANDDPLFTSGYNVSLNGRSIGGCTGCEGVTSHVLPSKMSSDTTYTVSLDITLTNGQVLRETGSFRTAFLSPATDWGNATWIGGGTLLKRTLPTRATKLVNATAYASGVGCFAMRIGGQLISDSFMDPGWQTLPTVRVAYRAFDVTSLMAAQTGNATELTVALGMCKYGYQDSFCIGGHAANGACKAFLLSLRMAYEDGFVTTVETSSGDGYAHR
jgi:hypothetical protein